MNGHMTSAYFNSRRDELHKGTKASPFFAPEAQASADSEVCVAYKHTPLHFWDNPFLSIFFLAAQQLPGAQ